MGGVAARFDFVDGTWVCVCGGGVTICLVLGVGARRCGGGGRCEQHQTTYTHKPHTHTHTPFPHLTPTRAHTQTHTIQYLCLCHGYLRCIPWHIPRISTVRSISVVYATGYNADIRGIGHKYYIRGIQARGYPQISMVYDPRKWVTAWVTCDKVLGTTCTLLGGMVTMVALHLLFHLHFLSHFFGGCSSDTTLPKGDGMANKS